MAANKIIEFPRTVEQRIEAAIAAFDSGDSSNALFKEFHDLIDLGAVEACYYAACMYEDGSNGVQKNPEYAFFYYKRTLDELGYLEGCLAVARFYYLGKGIPQDYAEAFRYYDLLARIKGNLIACFMLGRMYQHGTGANKNNLRARYWYLRAIRQGSVFGMLNLAMLEAEEGHFLRSIFLRMKARLSAAFITLRNPRDGRLRGG